MTRRKVMRAVCLIGYGLFLILSLAFEFAPGRAIGRNFALFFVDMLNVLPPAFILIGLFEVWVKRETVEKHLGRMSGFRGYFWAVLLAGTTVGGLYVAFPVASALYKKGAKLSVIFTYVGASGVCRIPMTVFEATFLGLEFTAIRMLVSLPLIIGSSMALGYYLEKRDYRMADAA